MIKELQVKKYRKLNNINLDFSNSMNLISGSNGTCKSSLLYLISNSFSKCVRSNPIINDKNCLKILSSIMDNWNLKMESLTKDSKVVDDNADLKGTIYTAKYENDLSLDFRKHNSKTSTGKNRFAIKPKYARGSGDSIPQLPVIYLGLSRLFSYGEYINDELIKIIKNKLPKQYIEQVQSNFKIFTQVDIIISEYEKMNDIKNRASFSSNIKGYDSNTISAGEDNLLIILIALETLHYYYDSINDQSKTASIFLIDEMDATLHPDYQVKLLNLFKRYADLYNIKFVFTSHSLTTIEYSLEKKYNVIYLINTGNTVRQIEKPNIFTIKSLLHNKLRDDIFAESAIPIFTEDEESRDFIDVIFDVYLEDKPQFSYVKSYLYFPQLTISSQQLKQMFSDPKLNKNFLHSICILDGDMKNDENISNSIIALPSNKSPESLLFEYMEELYANNDEFTLNTQLVNNGFSKDYYTECIKNKIIKFENEIEQKKAAGVSTKGEKREFYKELYNGKRKYLKLFLKHWARQNKSEVGLFMKNFHKVFLKVAIHNDVPNDIWEFSDIR